MLFLSTFLSIPVYETDKALLVIEVMIKRRHRKQNKLLGTISYSITESSESSLPETQLVVK